MRFTSINPLRRAEINGVRISAMDAFLIPFISLLRRAYMLPLIILSYFLLRMLGTGIDFSFYPFVLSMLATVPNDHFVSSDTSSSKDNSRPPEDHVEILGGNGPKVAAYIRISKKGQSEFSLDAQCDEINKLREKFKPSKIAAIYNVKIKSRDKW